MSVDIFGVKGGGPKYRDNIHDFKAAVFGYSLAGVIAMVTIHSVVLSSAAGHQKWTDVVSAGITTALPAK